MITPELPRDVHVLRTRIPRGRTVEGLAYGRHVGAPGWDGCYVRPYGAITWGVARLAPAAEAPGDDVAIVAAIRAELEGALSNEVRAALRLLQADPLLVTNGRRERGNTLAGAMLARPIGPIGTRRAAEAAVAEAVAILEGDDTAVASGQARRRGGRPS